MKPALLSFLFFGLLTQNAIAETETTSFSEASQSSFSCADDLLDSIHILGRGDDFPAFVFEDVETELKRQSDTSELLDLVCNGEPEIGGSVANVEEQGKTYQALEKLSIKFPLTATVKNRSQHIELNLKFGYLVENLLREGQQKTTQNFVVISQKNLD